MTEASLAPRPSRHWLSLLLVPAWPALIWLGLRYDVLFWLLPLMLGTQLLALRRAPAAGPTGHVAPLAAGAGILLCLASAVMRQHQWLLYYPVVVNTLLLGLFGSSLWGRMPLVERIARLRDPDLPPRAIHYTRQVTRIWCGFFVVNGGIALLTCLAGNVHWWTLWNGLLSYLLMGGLMAGEWLFRQWYIKQDR